MAKQGWMSVRDLPGTKNKTIKEVLDYFKRNFVLCSECNGVGYLVDKHDSVYEGVSTIRFDDHKGIEKMREDGILNRDVLKRIIETVIHNREQCDKCNGFGFVKKSRKKKNEKFTL